jgi:hypothetical protein
MCKLYPINVLCFTDGINNMLDINSTYDFTVNLKNNTINLFSSTINTSYILLVFSVTVIDFTIVGNDMFHNKVYN